MLETAQTSSPDISALSGASLDAFHNALLAAKIFSIAGHRLGGIHLRSRASATRNAFMDHLREARTASPNWIKITPNISTDRLIGGLDIAATAKAGRPVRQSGVLSQAMGGTLVIGLAEKLEGAVSAIIAQAIDGSGDEKISVVAIDEGLDESEGIPTSLKDRLGLFVDLNLVAWHHTDFSKGDTPLPDWSDCEGISIDDGYLQFFSTFAQAMGNASFRALFHLVDIARTLAAIEGEKMVSREHAVMAIKLKFGFMPQFNQPEDEQAAEPEQNDAPPPPSSDAETPDPAEPEPEDAQTPKQIDLEQLLDLAVKVETGSKLGELDLASLGATKDSRAASGKSGKSKSGAKRGRSIGITPTPPYGDARPDIPSTIRTAAPWQKLRTRKGNDAPSAAQNNNKIAILTSDFRYKRFKHTTRSTAIFVVDASGSTALERLGETKGAIEMLLANCYVRRDEVALVTFRGTAAETVLEPTRSLVRAKRTLSEMAGGGPTPLALGIRQAFQTALNVRRQGFTPIIILLTDGSGNIDLVGEANRLTAGRDSEAMARQVAAAAIKSVCIDISRRPRAAVTQLASQMNADYCPLPNANAASMSKLVNTYMENTSDGEVR